MVGAASRPAHSAPLDTRWATPAETVAAAGLPVRSVRECDGLRYGIGEQAREGQPASSTWDTARATLERYDPHRIFRSPLLDRLMP
ncbi:cholesterol oxidase substrate-binding domain-containing protein [Burkholderia arboris]|uniref:cholesterol oxidase substrate-binding domain-containing protein n=1 Tax=Burkholderia arboris TaxID=488730 RepID=UPI003BEED857